MLQALVRGVIGRAEAMFIATVAQRRAEESHASHLQVSYLKQYLH